MPEPISPEAMKPGEARTIPGTWRSGEDAQREFEATSMKGEEVGRTSLDEPTPVAVQARRSSLIDRFLQRLGKKPKTDQPTEASQ